MAGGPEEGPGSKAGGVIASHHEAGVRLGPEVEAAVRRRRPSRMVQGGIVGGGVARAGGGPATSLVGERPDGAY